MADPWKPVSASGIVPWPMCTVFAQRYTKPTYVIMQNQYNVNCMHTDRQTDRQRTATCGFWIQCTSSFSQVSILPSHLSLGPVSGLIHSGLPVKILYAFPSVHMRATRPARPIFINSFRLIIFSEQYNIWSFNILISLRSIKRAEVITAC
jgi:hypothetical protein